MRGDLKSNTTQSKLEQQALQLQAVLGSIAFVAACCEVLGTLAQDHESETSTDLLCQHSAEADAAVGKAAKSL